MRRVRRALDMAARTVDSVAAARSAPGRQTARTTAVQDLVLQKIVAETAMLLLCAAPLRDLDVPLRSRFDDVAALLVPHARAPDVLSAICMDPGLALDYAVAHVLLTRLGYPDADTDRLLRESLSLDPDFGPERLPHQRLEQHWLGRLRGKPAKASAGERGDLADSMLGRPMDALGSTRFDVYGFTHAVMYASDLGERRVTLPRSARSIAADADAGLAYSLDADDFDLTAELALTWPMLGLAWSPTSVFAFRLLAEVEDELGFLPGITFDRSQYDGLTDDERSGFVVRTSYHSTYIMGFLCAVASRPGCTPPAGVVRGKRSRDAGAAIMHLLSTDRPSPRWVEAFARLDARQQDSLAPVGLAAVLRRARMTGDLHRIRDALELALAHDLIDAPAPRQAVALLRRARALDEATKGAVLP